MSRPAEFGRMNIDILVEPLVVEDGRMTVRFWSAGAGRPVEARVELPPRVTPEQAMDACREGRLVLVPGHGRLAWARG